MAFVASLITVSSATSGTSHPRTKATATAHAGAFQLQNEPSPLHDMNANNQQQLIDKYQQLAAIYSTPNERPAGNDQTELRRWYRNCVLDCNNLVEILLVCEQLLTDLEDEDYEEASMEADSKDQEAVVLGNRLMSQLWRQVQAQRVTLERTAETLGLTAPEWDFDEEA